MYIMWTYQARAISDWKNMLCGQSYVFAILQKFCNEKQVLKLQQYYSGLKPILYLNAVHYYISLSQACYFSYMCLFYCYVVC